MSGLGHILPGRVHILHSRAGAEGSQVCPALHNGKRILHYGVRIPVRVRDNGQTNVLEGANVGLDQLHRLSAGHLIFLDDPSEYSTHCPVRRGPDNRPVLDGAGICPGRIKWIEILRSDVQVISVEYPSCITAVTHLNVHIFRD